MKLIRFVPGICWWLLSFYLLTLPGNRLPKLGWFDAVHGDKFVHIGMFSLLVVLFLMAFKRQSVYRLQKTALYFGLSALVYGIAMEFVQKYFVPFRSFEIADIAADATGAFLPYFGLVIKMKSFAEPS